MKTNQELQTDVQNAIKWEPLLNAAEIAVTSKDVVVTLSDTVDSYGKKLEAELAAKKVMGAKVLVEKIEVRFSQLRTKNNVEIANEALSALKPNWSVPKDKVNVKVEDGWVTSQCELPWNYQREASKDEVKHLTGVRGVTNNIKIKSNTSDTIEQKAVEDAIARSWSMHDGEIKVAVSGTTVTLFGIVTSLFQKEQAGRIACDTSGIRHVKNELVVDYYYSLAHKQILNAI